jgi:hypothetical protein
VVAIVADPDDPIGSASVSFLKESLLSSCTNRDDDMGRRRGWCWAEVDDGSDPIAIESDDRRVVLVLEAVVVALVAIEETPLHDILVVGVVRLLRSTTGVTSNGGISSVVVVVVVVVFRCCYRRSCSCCGCWRQKMVELVDRFCRKKTSQVNDDCKESYIVWLLLLFFLLGGGEPSTVQNRFCLFVCD